MAGNLPFGLAPSGELSNYTPTLREKVADWLRQSLFTDDREGQDKANRLTNWGETMIPPFGFATQMYDAGRAGGEGNYMQAGMLGAMAMMPGGSKKGIRAFHGSPHSFDKFSMDKIGTGEGAQAYGHGLYFAENEGVAKGYRDHVFADPDATFFKTATGKQIATDQLRSFGAQPDALKLATEDLRASLSSARLKQRVMPSSEADDRIKGLEEAISYLETKVKPGSMYEVSINADPNAFLDWDKPLSEQPEAVQNAIPKLIESAPQPKKGPSIRNRQALNANDGSVPGDIIWNNLGGHNYPEETRKRFLEAGIPGIKYLDAGSRGAGDGTRNYVVFDDKLISIVRKYGIAGASALLGYDIMQNVTPAQAEELKNLEGGQ